MTDASEQSYPSFPVDAATMRLAAQYGTQAQKAACIDSRMPMVYASEILHRLIRVDADLQVAGQPGASAGDYADALSLIADLREEVGALEQDIIAAATSRGLDPQKYLQDGDVR